MTEAEMKAKFEELQRLNAELKKKLGEDDDSIRKAEIDALVKAQIAALHDTQKGKKVIFSGEPKADEVKMTFQKFLVAVARHDHATLKTIMEVQTAGQGGYAVPTGFATEILGALNNVASLPGMATEITQEQYSVRYPSWLTDLSVSWVAENGEKSLTKPTLTYLTSLLKKMACIVPFTDELLDDNNVDLQGKVTALVGENMGVEIERVALVGNTGAGDAFNGVLNAGCLATPQAGAALSYDDLVDACLNPNMLRRYRQGSGWWINATALAICMKLKDLQNRPIWQPAIAAGQPSMLLGYPVNETDQIAVAGGTTSIIFGNVKNIILAGPKKNPGINVKVSDSAVEGAGDSDYVGANAFKQDETWYRFVKRQGILVAVPTAFSAITGVK